MTVAARSRLAGILPSSFRLREAPALVEQARMVKDDDEIACLRSAVILGASLFDRALEVIRPGVRETEVAAEMEYAARKAGAEAMSFETIIASGERSALPHGRASQAAIPGQGFVVCDFGVILSGYCSDMTRTVYVGRPSAEARGVYQAVKQAQLAAVDAVRPGISVAEVDRAARKSLQKSGLAKYFTHSTGHGVGLEIHEAPAGGSRADGDPAAGHGDHHRTRSLCSRQVGRAHRRYGCGHRTRVRGFDTHQQGTGDDLKRAIVSLTPGGVPEFGCAFPAGAQEGRSRSHRITMNQKELKELIEFLIEKDIAEFELERGDVKVRIKRGKRACGVGLRAGRALLHRARGAACGSRAGSCAGAGSLPAAPPASAEKRAGARRRVAHRALPDRGHVLRVAFSRISAVCEARRHCRSRTDSVHRGSHEADE